MSRLCAADLSVDSLVYNGMTTACDSLWANVPLVSAPGHTMCVTSCEAARTFLPWTSHTCAGWHVSPRPFFWPRVRAIVLLSCRLLCVKRCRTLRVSGQGFRISWPVHAWTFCRSAQHCKSFVNLFVNVSGVTRALAFRYACLILNVASAL